MVGGHGVLLWGRWGQQAWPGPGGRGGLLPPPLGAQAALPTRMDTEGLPHGRHQHSLYQRECVLQANYALFHGQKESKEV